MRLEPAGRTSRSGRISARRLQARGAGGDRAPLRADWPGGHLPLALRGEGHHVSEVLLQREDTEFRPGIKAGQRNCRLALAYRGGVNESLRSAPLAAGAKVR